MAIMLLAFRFFLIVKLDVIIQDKSYKKHSNGSQQIEFARHVQGLEENYFFPPPHPPQNQEALNNTTSPLRSDVKTISDEDH